MSAIVEMAKPEERKKLYETALQFRLTEPP
jgi:hypothetical protein